jgi:hypothetical protein
MTKRILVTILFGFIFSPLTMAAEPENINFGPLVSFDGIIAEIVEVFTDILKEYWAMLLSLFAVWFAVGCAKAFLDSKAGKYKLQVEREKRIVDQFNRAEEKREVQSRMRELEVAREVAQELESLEAEYRSQQMFDRFGNRKDRVTFHVDQKEGYRYKVIDFESDKAFDLEDVLKYARNYHYEAEKLKEDLLDEPLDFDNDDHGRVYRDGVAVDVVPEVIEGFEDYENPKEDEYFEWYDEVEQEKNRDVEFKHKEHKRKIHRLMNRDDEDEGSW